MADDNTAKTDLWFDWETGKVVKSQPARGKLLARKGGRITAAAQVRMDALDADPDAEPIAAHVALGTPEAVEVGDDNGNIQTVTTDDAPKPAKRTTKAAKKSG